jgi:integrase
VKEERDKFILPAECETLTQFVKQHGPRRDHILLLAGMNLAMRAGEVVRLRCEDLRPGEGHVLVPTLKRLSAGEKKEKREARRAGKKWKKQPLKRGDLPKLYLEVPIPKDVMQEIQEYIRLEGIESWLFPGRDGKHISKRQAERIYKRWAKEVGISIKSSIHALRHARGLDFYEKGLDPLEIQELLRHESASSSLLYQHLTPSRKQKLKDKIGTLGMPADDSMSPFTERRHSPEGETSYGNSESGEKGHNRP